MTSLFVLFGIRLISIDFSESISNSLLKFFSSFSCLKVIFSNVLNIREIIDNKSGRHNMVLVDVFNEALDSSFLDEFLLAFSSLGSDQVTSDTCNQEMREFVSFASGLVTLDNNSFLSCMSALSKYNNSTSFEDSAHCL
eukprot:TRINITY_DN1526_c0_g1_i3.p1 TRINITY_DN1526_c0_g1~~TRINITY_DN1526_c0_g1_i3.p1  ORF type:complete len:139 (-),score=11.45 TRINITY_DN1526_c0_g1_i3:9-425(-)